MAERDSVYNDPAYDVSSIPSWKQTPPLHGAYAPNARLSPRAKAGVAVAGVALAATGMFAWSQYASASADAEVKRAQIALDQSRIDLERQKQEASLVAESARTTGVESDAQKARREAVQACVAKAAGAYGAIADCGKAYPVVDAPGMVNTAQKVASSEGDGGSNSGVGLAVLGGAGVLVAFGWAKKRFAKS
ncbi:MULTISPECIES: hypothetical protein [Streptomycetaceae]|uniref:hypothetical protein n=1 Tax=Streptomycetaceae TaxID=2062 RepID=UPI0009403D7C|nr:hypothetical protein [Streptomyces sp. CB02056]OKH97525.1 hypothetical protein AMK13_38075 [Streptomyces sp. CB02056]